MIRQLKSSATTLVLFTAVIAAATSSATLASKPDQERSLQRCELLIKGIGSRSTDYFSASSLIPLTQLLGTKYCDQIAKNHIEGAVNQKSFPTQGMAQMYLTARTAADALIDDLDIQAKRPNYQTRDLIGGAEETLRVMMQDQPEFIREGLLIRDGVVMIVPLLYRVEPAAGGRPPLYTPIIVKGHQELEKFDVLSAAFAAWALGQYLDRIPSKAYVHLKPMAKIRKRVKTGLQPDDMYTVTVAEQMPAVELIHQTFLDTISDPDKLAEIQPRRCTQCNICPWAAHCRSILNANNDLSMMPYPPSEGVDERLGEIGLGTMDKLSELDLNSTKFIEAAIYTGATPERLRYWIAHARAKIKNKPILLEPYEFPFEDVSKIAHIDFEDIMVRDVPSGVYLFGTEIEQNRRVADKNFIFAQTLDKLGVDKAWAEFIRFLKKNKILKGGDYQISIYSPHELVKFQQEFDMLIDPPEEFSDAQRRSPYYSEAQKLAPAADPEAPADIEAYAKPRKQKLLGRFIRRKDFFRNNPDITPQDIFDIMDRAVDLLDYVRWNFAFPTHSNSLKSVLPYLSEGAGLKISYPEGWNGLESVKWAKSAYETGEQRIFENIRAYNEIDIDANYVVTSFLRRNAGKAGNREMQYSAATREVLDKVAYAASTRSLINRLEGKDDLLEKIMGRAVVDLSEAEVADLADILDRTQYLAARKRIDDSKKLEDKEKEQELQMLGHNNENTRKNRLIDFFKRARANSDEPMDDATTDQIAKLFLEPTTFVLPTHLYQMIALAHFKMSADHLSLKLSKDTQGRLDVPIKWLTHFFRVSSNLQNKYPNSTLDSHQLRMIWDGLYFERAFDGSRVR